MPECACGCGATFEYGRGVRRSKRFASHKCAQRAGVFKGSKQAATEIVECACGCGKTFKVSPHSRGRRFFSPTHNDGSGYVNGMRRTRACTPETAKKLAALLYAISIVGPIAENGLEGRDSRSETVVRRSKGLRRD